MASRKEYVMVAETIRSEYKKAINDDASADAFSALDNVATSLAAKFKVDNSSFDDKRFLKACGLDQ